MNLKFSLGKVFSKSLILLLFLFLSESGFGQTISAGNDLTICQNASVSITPTETGMPSNATITWYVLGSTTPLSANTSSQGVFTVPTANSGTTTYVVKDQSTSPTTITVYDTVVVIVTQQITPNFNQVAAICAGGSFTLPTTSNNGIIGSWSPAKDNQQTTTYTFTPSSGQCARSTTMTVNVTPKLTPNFTQVSPICKGSTFTLPTTSNNGVIGAWTPALNYQSTTTYTFTPNSGQCVNSTLTTMQVQVRDTPVASFNAITNGGCPTKKEVKFNNTSTGNGLSYSWNFGDPGGNNTSTDLAPKHKFSQINTTYTVRLTVTDNNGCTSTSTQTISIGAVPDAALNDDINFPPFKVCNSSNFSIIVSDASTTTSINTQYQIKWGDGTIYNSSTPPTSQSHTYSSTGFFYLTYVVFSGTCKDSTEYEVYIGSNPSVSLSSPGNTTYLCLPQTITFKIDTLVTRNNPLGTTYQVTFNDGSPDTVFNHPPPAFFTHTFTKSSCGATPASIPNAFEVKIFATNPCGTTPGGVGGITTVLLPDANFSITPDTVVCVNSNVTFANTSLDGNVVITNGSGSTVSYTCDRTNSIFWSITAINGVPNSWSIIAGSTGTFSSTPGSSPLVTSFSQPGTYKIMLIVRNNATSPAACRQDTTYKIICVQPHPIPAFTATPTVICVNLNPVVNFTNTSTNLPTCGTYLRSWRVRKISSVCNTPSGYAYIAPTDSTSDNPSIRFSQEGQYEIKLFLKTVCGWDSSSPTIITVKDKPVVSINTTPLASICYPTVNTINPTATICAAGGTISGYSWTFTNGTANSTTISNPTVTYPTIGNFPIQLSVTNECGTTNAANQQIIVNPLPTITGTTTICANGTTQLIGNGASQSWSSSNTGVAIVNNTGLVTGVSAGTTTITYTNSNGCSKTILITVNGIPSVSVNSASSSICIGGSTTLTASGANTYIWSPSTGLNTTSGSTVTANPTTTSSYNVIGTDANGCKNSSNITVTVNPLPNVTAAANNASICIGGSTVLNAGGASTYTWSPATGLSSTSGSSVTASPTTTTTYTVTGTTTNTGCQNTAIVTVTVNSLPVVTVNPISPSICNGNSTILTAGGANTYSWQPNINLSSSSGTTVTASPTVSTTYTVTGTDANGCRNTATSNVTVNPLPTITGPNQVCQNSNITLVGSGTPASVNPWVSSTPTVATINNSGFVTGITVGSTTITYTDNLGCQKTFSITVKQTPSIALGAIVAPNNCTNPNGSITISGILTNVSTTINYVYTTTTSSSNGSIPIPATNTLSTYTISSLAAGTYNITLSYNGCTSPSVTQILTAPSTTARPTASNDTTICSGGTLNFAVLNPASGASTTYDWHGPAGFSLTNTTSVSIPNTTISNSGWYWVTATKNSCTSIPDSIYATINPLPAKPGVRDTTYCQNATASSILSLVTSGAGNTTNWFNLSGTATATAPTPSTTTVTPPLIKYLVSQTNTTTGCVSPADTVRITVNPTPSVANQNTTICSGFNFNVKPTGVPQGTLYTWLNPVSSPLGAVTGGSASVSPVDSVSQLLFNNSNAPATLTYRVYPKTGNCSGNAFNIIVTVNPNPIINVDSQTICHLGSTTLTATGATNYNWTPSTGLNSTTGNSVIANPTNTGSTQTNILYTVIGSYTTGCSDTAYSLVKINPLPVKPGARDTTYCQNTQITFAAPLTAVSSANTVLNWFNSNNQSLSSAPSPSIGIVNNTVYYVSQRDTITGCTGPRDSIRVSVNSTPVISAYAVDPSICASSTGKIIIKGLINGLSYTVKYDTSRTVTLINQLADGDSIIINNLPAGNYSIVRVLLVGCESNAIDLTLSNPSPPATPIATTNATICSGKTLTLSASTTSVGIATYAWTTPKNYHPSGSNITIPNITVSDTGTYYVTATISGCKSNAGSVHVMIDSTPAKPQINANTPLCTDSTLTLTATTISTMPVSWSWAGPGTFLPSPASQNVSIANTTLANAGNYKVIVTSLTGNCKDSATQLVVINQTPKIISAYSKDPTLCQSKTGSIVLHGLVSGTTYIVHYKKNGIDTTLNGVVAVGDSVVIDNLSSSTYSSIYLVTIGCPSNQVGPFTLTDPNPPAAPVLTSNTAVCTNDTIHIDVVSPVLNTVGTYSWTTPTNAHPTGSSLVINNASMQDSGIYSVTLTINNCQSSPTQTLFEVHSRPPAPVVTTPVIYCQVQTASQLTATALPGNTLNWYTSASGGTSSAIAPLPSTTNTGTTSYYVSQTNTNGCEGPRNKIDVVVNATPVVGDDIVNVCSGSRFTITPPIGNGIPAGTLYSWSVPTSFGLVGGQADTNQASITGVLTDTTDFQQTASYTVIPRTGSCSGLPFNVTVIVNPGPRVIYSPGNQKICSGDNTASVSLTSATPNVSIPWSLINAPATVPGLIGSGTSTIPSQQLSNLTNSPVTLNYTATASTTVGASCPGNPVPYTIIVNPTPIIHDTSFALCSGGSFSYTPINSQPYNIVPRNTTYTWSVSPNNYVVGQSDTTLSVSFIGQTLINLSNITQIITYHVSPVSGDSGYCKGDTFDITVTIYPKPHVLTLYDTICSGTTFVLSPIDAQPNDSVIVPSGTFYNWTAPFVAGITGTSPGINQSNISNTISNNTFAPLTVKYIVTPTSGTTGACVGDPFEVYITVNPLSAISNNPLYQKICNEGITDSVVWTSLTAGAHYSWSLVSSGNVTGYVPDAVADTMPRMQLYNYGDDVDSVVYAISSTSNACAAPATNYTFYVNPDARDTFAFTKDTACWPFVIDSNVIKNLSPNTSNGTYYWYVTNYNSTNPQQTLIGTGYTFPGYTIQNPDDSIEIKLVGFSQYGCKGDSITHRFFTRHKAKPNFSFTYDPTSSCGPNTITFTNTTPYINSFAYQWNFGIAPNTLTPPPSILTSNLPQPPSVLYQSDLQDFVAATYQVTLTVNSNDFCEIQDTTIDVVIQSKPKALFVPDIPRPCSNTNIHFTNASLPNVPPDNATTYIWNFGDSSPVYITNNRYPAVEHIYNSGVVDTIITTLTAINGCGADTLSFPIIVSPITIIPAIQVTPFSQIGCAPHEVVVVNNSSGGQTYTWDFGDATQIVTTGQRTPDTIKHIYTQCGNYTVVGHAYNACSDTAANVFVRILCKPQPKFTPLNSGDCVGHQIHFVNQTITADSINTRYIWHFQDGTTDSGYSPTHIYQNPGVYYDTLVAILFDLTSGKSCSEVYVGTVTIIDSLKGNVTIIGSRGNCKPSTVIFINNNRPSLSATWDFGDNTSLGIGDSVTHTYTDTGTYIIHMTAVEPGGCKNGYTDTVKIGGSAGQLIYSANNVCLPYTATKLEVISNAATDSIHWYFGDGKDTTTFNISTNPSTIIYHHYSTPGAYTPRVVLYASQGLCMVPVQGSTTIRVDSVNAGFRYTDNLVCDSTQINFFDTSYAFSGIQYSIWSYGTGAINDTGIVTSNYYTINNTYQVTHTLVSNLGCRDTSKQNIVIQLHETPKVQIQGPDPICIYTSGMYSAQTLSTTDPINYYNWTVTNPSGVVVVTSVDTFVNISFRVSGTYNIRLIIGTTFGCYDTIVKNITVIPSSIKINYTLNSVGCTPHIVQIINNSVGANTYSWNFGDVAGPIPPTSANTIVSLPGQTVTHTYQNPGTYYITMLAQNGGCTDTTIIDSVKVLTTPQASFNFTVSDNCVNHTIQFNNTTTIPNNTPAQYSWNFGDLTPLSTVLNPNHLYATAGNYIATLTSSISYPNGLTCSTNYSLPVPILDTLQGNVTVSSRYGICKPFTVTFTNNIRPVQSITWDFGDNSPLGTTDVVTHTYTDTGTYIVHMIAIDPGGCKYKYTDTIIVGGAAGNMQYSSNVACLPYGNTRLEILSNAATDSIHWFFGDGRDTVTINGIGLTSTIVNHHYNLPGVYNPRAVLYSQNGTCIVPIQGPTSVKVDSVSAGFSYTQNKVCDSTQYYYTDHSYAFSGLQTFGWDFGFGPTTTTGTTVYHNYTIGGTFNIIETVTSQWGCVDKDTVSIDVIVHQTPSAQINSADSACSNDTMHLTSIINSVDTVLNNNINWTVQPPVGTPIIHTGANYNFAVTTPGKYYIYLSVTTIYGCSKAFKDSFIVYPYPSLVVGLNPKICLNQSVQLSASGAPNYSWTPITTPNNLSCYTCPNPTANPTTTTTYTVTSQEHGCSISKDITVKVVQPFTMTSPPNDTICIGQSTILTANGAPNYLWTPGGFISQSITVSPLVTTTYHLTGTDNDNCFRTDTNIVVAVGQYPVITMGHDTILSTGTLFLLNSSITNGPIRYYTWSPTIDLDSPYSPRPIANVKNNVCYTLVAENEYGCADTGKICIRVFCEDSQVFIPNAFTPGDASRGNNILMVRATGIKQVKQFTIFNRWGQIVFERQNFQPNDPSSGWDGKIKGTPAASGVFVYIAEVVCENDVHYMYKGNVTLLK